MLQESLSQRIKAEVAKFRAGSGSDVLAELPEIHRRQILDSADEIELQENIRNVSRIRLEQGQRSLTLNQMAEAENSWEWKHRRILHQQGPQNTNL